MESIIFATMITLIMHFGYILLEKQPDLTQKEHKSYKQQDFAEKEEFRQTYKLQPGTKVAVADINGVLEIETSDTDIAEVYIVRSAKNREDLQFEKVVVEQNGDTFVISMKAQNYDKLIVENNGKNKNSKKHISLWKHPETTQKVYLKLPKSIDLHLSDISGFAKVGDLQGALRINDISGEAYIGQVGKCQEISDISGNVYIKETADCKRINDISGGVEMELLQVNKLNIEDISGNVNIKFLDDVNANLIVRDISGDVAISSLNLTITKKYDENDYDGKIGLGGVPIKISDISGSVKLMKKR